MASGGVSICAICRSRLASMYFELRIIIITETFSLGGHTSLDLGSIGAPVRWLLRNPANSSSQTRRECHVTVLFEPHSVIPLIRYSLLRTEHGLLSECHFSSNLLYLALGTLAPPVLAARARVLLVNLIIHRHHGGFQCLARTLRTPRLKS